MLLCLRAQRASTGSAQLVIALQDLSPAVWSRSCPDTGNEAGTAEDSDILERCQLPLRRLQTFFCVEDRAICTSSHSPINLSLLWSEIRRVDGSVHHVSASRSELYWSPAAVWLGMMLLAVNASEGRSTYDDVTVLCGLLGVVNDTAWTWHACVVD